MTLRLALALPYTSNKTSTDEYRSATDLEELG